jgi:site-specific DNA-methyltransferase (adenine-specific)
MNITNEDNMLLMSRYPDKYFDLAIVDPPYGISITKQSGFGALNKEKKFWDNETPTKEYFKELKRVSKNQIIWGANYFLENLNSTPCFIAWDKMNGTNDMADFELAWTSFNTACRRFDMHHFSSGYDSKIHPTQKPVKLYKWILDKYAKEGDKILDTHLGSGSIAIACHDYGFDLTACELDKEYFDKAIERIENHKAQLKLF